MLDRLKLIVFSFFILYLIIVTGCKENNPLDTNGIIFSYHGRVYSLVDSVKVSQHEIQVILNNDTTNTDSLGEFEFTNLRTGEYTILFKYYNVPSDSLISISKLIQIPQSEEVTEFILTNLYNFSGRAFMIIDSVKVPQNNVDVYLNNDTTKTDTLGEFEFCNLLYGNYTITFKYYDSNIDSVLFASYSILIPQVNVFTEFILPGEVNVSGEVFSYINNEKVYLENAKIKIGQYTTYTNYEGRFVLPAPILPGNYNVFVGEKDFYSSIDSTFSISANSYLEFELKPLINEDIIFINNDDYYYRYKNGDIIQLTSSGETISDDLEFSDQVDYFIYTSRNGSQYHLNLVDLNSHQHNILYSSTSKITQPTISPDGSRIYVMRGNTAGYVTLEGGIFQEVFSLASQYWQGYLFHNCEDIITAYKPDEWTEIIIQINFLTNDTTVVDTFYDMPARVQEISSDDKYVSFLFDSYPAGCNLLNTQNYQWSNYNSVEGFTGWGKFFDAGNKVFGNDFEMVDPNTGNMITGGIITDILSGNKVFIYDDDIYYWRPDYSSENNSYLYSTYNYSTGIRAIWFFDVNSNKKYDVMPSEPNVWGARYVPGVISKY